MHTLNRVFEQFEEDCKDNNAKYDRLMAALEELKETKRLTQTVAMESELLIPLSKLPNIFFSGTDSIKKYELAVEEINHGLVALLVAIIAAIGVMIMKVIEHFWGGSSSGSGGSFDSGKTMEQMRKEQDDFLKNMAKMDQANINSIKNDEMDKILEKINKNAAHLAFNYSAFLTKEMTGNRGPLFDALVACSTLIDMVSKQAEQVKHAVNIEPLLKEIEAGKNPDTGNVFSLMIEQTTKADECFAICGTYKEAYDYKNDVKVYKITPELLKQLATNLKGKQAALDSLVEKIEKGKSVIHGLTLDLHKVVADLGNKLKSNLDKTSDDKLKESEGLVKALQFSLTKYMRMISTLITEINKIMTILERATKIMGSSSSMLANFLLQSI